MPISYLVAVLLALAGLTVALTARRPVLAASGGLALGGVYVWFALNVAEYVAFALLFAVMAMAGVALGLGMGWARYTMGGAR